MAASLISKRVKRLSSCSMIRSTAGPEQKADLKAEHFLADDARMLELLEPYRCHRRRVVLLLKGAGIKAPKYGPRHALRAIENI